MSVDEVRENYSMLPEEDRAGLTAMMIEAQQKPRKRGRPRKPPDPIFAAIEAHRKAAAVERAAWDEVTRRYELADEKFGPSDEWALTEGHNAKTCVAQDELAETVPTTLTGLLSMIVYASEVDDADPEAFNLCQQSLAAAAQALMLLMPVASEVATRPSEGQA